MLGQEKVFLFSRIGSRMHILPSKHSRKKSSICGQGLCSKVPFQHRLSQFLLLNPFRRLKRKHERHFPSSPFKMSEGFFLVHGSYSLLWPQWGLHVIICHVLSMECMIVGVRGCYVPWVVGNDLCLMRDVQCFLTSITHLCFSSSSVHGANEINFRSVRIWRTQFGKVLIPSWVICPSDHISFTLFGSIQRLQKIELILSVANKSDRIAFFFMCSLALAMIHSSLSFLPKYLGHSYSYLNFMSS